MKTLEKPAAADVLNLLEPEKVRLWLASLPPDEIVGRANHLAECPLSRYLAENGIPGVAIGNPFFMSSFSIVGTPFSMDAFSDAPRHNLPEWVEYYAQDLDECAPYGCDEENELEYNNPEISAGLALECLQDSLEGNEP